MYLKPVRLSLLIILCLCTTAGQMHAAGPSQKSQHDLLKYELNRLAGEETLQQLSNSNRGKEFFSVLGNDEAWLTDLLDSGPVKEPQRVLSFLHQVWLDDNTVQQHPVNRSMATACALALGMNSRLEEDWMWKRYVYFRDSWKDGLLNQCYGDLATWERRYLARGPQYSSYSTAEAMTYLRDQICLPRAAYTGACWRAPYRGHNCFGDSVQGPRYYLPFRGLFSCDPEMAIEVGGVCGALSNLGTAAAIANGIPATSMGEPGHCAYAVQTQPGKWQPAYSLSWKRGMHTSLYRGTWPALTLDQACFEKLELVQKAGHLMRLSHWYEDQGNFAEASKTIQNATQLHPLHYGLWQDRAELGIRHKVDFSWWTAYHKDVLEYLAVSHEEPAWALLTSYAYKTMKPDMTDSRYATLFFTYMKAFDDFGNGRWNIEGAWNWMLGQIRNKNLQRKFERRLASEVITRPGIGAALLAWEKQRCGDDEQAWVDFQNWLVKRLAREEDNVDSIIRNLGRTAMPAAAKRGDRASYQAIGKLCSRLYKPKPTDGVKPFAGELLTEGGYLNISGIGERYDSPEQHWGILNMHGGALHTNSTETPWIEVRLGNFGRLNGLVIQNRAGGYQWRAGGARVLVSTDGDKWKQIAVLEGAKTFYRIDLTDSKPLAGWLRIERDGHCMHFARILAYGKRVN